MLDRLGRPLRDLRISVTDRCNFRCGYCMPDGDAGSHTFVRRDGLLRFEEIERLARLFVRALGVRKLRLTGGEPLLRRNLPELVARLSTIEDVEDLALTTNGYLLCTMARPLADAGLGRVTVSLDSLDPEVFKRMSGVDRELQTVLQGIDAAAEAGLLPIKINCVVQRGMNEQSIVPLARWARTQGHAVRFIEYMDVGTINDWRSSKVMPADEIHAALETIAPLHPVQASYRGEVAQRYRYADGRGEVGIIASITRPFCGDCQRARLSADGHFLTCLFGAEGSDLRARMRQGDNDASLLTHLQETWRARTDRYSERRHEQRHQGGRRRLEMYQIGG